MRLIFLSLLICIVLNGIMGYRARPMKRRQLANLANYLWKRNVDYEEYEDVDDLFDNNDESDEIDENDLDYQEIMRALESLESIWGKAYRDGKLRPIFQTFHKINRLVLQKTDSADLKNILNTDNEIIELLEKIDKRNETSKLLEKLSNSKEIQEQVLNVFASWGDVSDLINNEIGGKIIALYEKAIEEKSVDDLITNVMAQGFKLMFILGSSKEEKQPNQVETAVNEISYIIINGIADGSVKPLLDATYDAAVLIVENVDFNDPKVKTLLSELIKLENLLKTTLLEIESSSSKRHYRRNLALKKLLNKF